MRKLIHRTADRKDKVYFMPLFSYQNCQNLLIGKYVLDNSTLNLYSFLIKSFLLTLA